MLIILFRRYLVELIIHKKIQILKRTIMSIKAKLSESHGQTNIVRYRVTTNAIKQNIAKFI